MIVKCDECSVIYDHEFRWTHCPHDTFLANDGKNNFRHYPESVRYESHELIQKEYRDQTRKLPDLSDLEYLGDSVSVGFDDIGRVVLVKEYSDGDKQWIRLDASVLGNFLEWIEYRKTG